MLRDPTQPLNYAATDYSSAESSNGSLKLSAVFYGSNPYAVISGKTVHVGETLGTYRVSRIYDGTVELKNGAETVTLRVLPRSVISGK
jgi:hypothetical protein